jgi:hypothetical protein
MPYPDARRLLDAGVTVALATDCNPGTSLHHLAAVLHRARRARVRDDPPRRCRRDRRRGGGAAPHDVGHLTPGARGDLVVLDAPSHVDLAYRPGVPLVACATGLFDGDLARAGLITLDAHHDVRHLDDGPRNGTPVRGLVADGLDPTRVVQIGIGRFTNSHAYATWCHERGIRTITAPEVHAAGIDEAVAVALDHLDDVAAIYVDLDVDVLDVAHAPACPGARPGGLTPDQLMRAASLLGAEPRVRAADLVEVDASADHDGRTVMATAMTLLAFAAGVALR